MTPDPPDRLDTYYATPMPVCPYCGYESRCVADLMTRIEHGEGTGFCHGCEREYAVLLEVVHTFTTRPKE
jgi:hypothetical protein